MHYTYSDLGYDFDKNPLLLLVLGILIFIIFSWLFSVLWNYLMPKIFNLPEINIYQAMGMIILTRILFH